MLTVKISRQQEEWEQRKAAYEGWRVGDPEKKKDRKKVEDKLSENI